MAGERAHPDNTAAEDFVMPAEFEPHAAIWMGWPKEQPYADPELDTRVPIAQIISALCAHCVNVKLMCTDERGEHEVRRWLRTHGYPIADHLDFVHIDQVDIWVRDYGPIFTRNRANRLGMARFLQNQWGYATASDPVSRAMTELPERVARHLGIDHVAAADVVSEGGGRIVNGRGTLLVCRAVETERNPQLDEADLERAYRAALGVTKVIWLNSGLGEDLHAAWGPVPYRDAAGSEIHLYGPLTTGGHLDELVRFAGPREIVLAQVAPEEAARDPLGGPELRPVRGGVSHPVAGLPISPATHSASSACPCRTSHTGRFHRRTACIDGWPTWNTPRTSRRFPMAVPSTWFEGVQLCQLRGDQRSWSSRPGTGTPRRTTRPRRRWKLPTRDGTVVQINPSGNQLRGRRHPLLHAAAAGGGLRHPSARPVAILLVTGAPPCRPSGDQRRGGRSRRRPPARTALPAR